jgi:hypothetical protein
MMLNPMCCEQTRPSPMRAGSLRFGTPAPFRCAVLGHTLLVVRLQEGLQIAGQHRGQTANDLCCRGERLLRELPPLGGFRKLGPR